ncbi:MAG: extracellular solute-binding protein [Candidatus Latescibacteria bacterium]|nr:extracellular solute-binding protein [bacterium]MBD3423738.1 extracellular solute-binding protein [Candidatus Latescibacterota bacterium]
MHLRKIITFIMLIAASVLYGCGGTEEGITSIVIWEQKDPEEQVLLERHLGEFREMHPEVEVSTVHFETDKLHSQFQTAALAGGGPDLVYGPGDKVGPYSVMDLIIPLEEEYPQGYFDSFREGSVPSLGGHIYAVPDQVGNHLMLIYNRELVEKAPEDTGEWISMAKELTVDPDGNGIPDRYGVVFNFMEPFWLVPFLGGYGGWVVDEDMNPTLDTEPMLSALRLLSDMRNKYRILPRESNYEVSDAMFKQGHAAFIINGPWSLKAYMDAGLDIAVIPIPKIAQTGSYPTPTLSSKGYSISVNVPGKKLEMVKELASYLTSARVQREITSELLILPSRKEIYEDEELFENEILRGSMRAAQKGRPMPLIPEMRAIWDAIRPFYQSVMGGRMEPAEAAGKMQERADQKIEEMKG